MPLATITIIAVGPCSLQALFHTGCLLLLVVRADEQEPVGPPDAGSGACLRRERVPAHHPAKADAGVRDRAARVLVRRYDGQEVRGWLTGCKRTWRRRNGAEGKGEEAEITHTYIDHQSRHQSHRQMCIFSLPCCAREGPWNMDSWPSPRVVRHALMPLHTTTTTIRPAGAVAGHPTGRPG